MGFYKKKEKPSVSIPKSAREEIRVNLLEHFRQYEYPRKYSEIVLSEILLDEAIKVGAITEENVWHYSTDIRFDDLVKGLTKDCIRFAENLYDSNCLEPLLDEYFAKHGNFR